MLVVVRALQEGLVRKDERRMGGMIRMVRKEMAAMTVMMMLLRLRNRHLSLSAWLFTTTIDDVAARHFK